MSKRYLRLILFRYRKNIRVNGEEHHGKVSGLLLYAKTTEETEPFLSVSMGGNPIEVRTLDLNRSFRDISEILDYIVVSNFGENLQKTA